MLNVLKLDVCFFIKKTEQKIRKCCSQNSCINNGKKEKKEKKLYMVKQEKQPTSSLCE